MENVYMHLVGDTKFQAFRARILEKIKTPEQRERERLSAAMERKKQKAARSAARAAARKVRSLAERKRRRDTDPVYALTARTRSLVSGAFRRQGLRKAEKTEVILGCSIEAFAAHIERQFLPGMTWVNRALWHIDHIVALATAVTEEDVIALNHFTNLRPLWKPDNLTKRDKALFLL